MTTSGSSGFSAAEITTVAADLQQQLAVKEVGFQQRDKTLEQRGHVIQSCHTRIQLLEELLRLKKIQQLSASSEKLAHQFYLFDESELEAEIDALRDQLPYDVEEEDTPRAFLKRRQRGFSDALLSERIKLILSDEEKVGASKVFFTKVKEDREGMAVLSRAGRCD